MLSFYKRRATERFKGKKHDVIKRLANGAVRIRAKGPAKAPLTSGSLRDQATSQTPTVHVEIDFNLRGGITDKADDFRREGHQSTAPCDTSSPGHGTHGVGRFL